MERFRAGLGLKAQRLLHHSTLGLRAIKKKNKQLEKSPSPPDNEDRDRLEDWTPAVLPQQGFTAELRGGRVQNPTIQEIS